jgi:hypothetical protein
MGTARSCHYIRLPVQGHLATTRRSSLRHMKPSQVHTAVLVKRTSHLNRPIYMRRAQGRSTHSHTITSSGQLQQSDATRTNALPTNLHIVPIPTTPCQSHSFTIYGPLLSACVGSRAIMGLCFRELMCPDAHPELFISFETHCIPDLLV